MKKNKFIKSTFTLLLGGMITKILGIFIRIIYTRIIGEYGISLYSLVMPTFSLIMCITTFSLPLSICKLVSEHKYSSKTIFLSSLCISIVINIVIILLVILLSSFIASKLLHQEICKYLLIYFALTIPFISISSIIRGYYYGKQNMFPPTIANIFEQILRIILYVTILPFVCKYSSIYGVVFLVLSCVFSEILSIFVMYLFLPKKINFNLCYSSDCIRDLLSISIPNVSSRLISNISYFFEPIIISSIMVILGYSSDYITINYGLYSSYALPLLLMPSFVVTAISNALVPEISKYDENKSTLRKKIRYILLFCLILGLFSSSFIYFFRDKLLYLFYKSNSASNYIKFLAPFFFLFYLEAPISSILVSLNANKDIFKITLISLLIKNIFLILFLYLDFKIYSLLISEIIDIVMVVFLYLFKLKKLLKN